MVLSAKKNKNKTRKLNKMCNGRGEMVAIFKVKKGLTEKVTLE